MSVDWRASGIRRFFRLPRSARSIASEIDDEIRFHIETRVDDLIAMGQTADEARAIAMREYGDAEDSRAELAALDRQLLRRHARDDWWDAFRQDGRYAARVLRRQPVLAITIVMTLALALGVNASMFGIIDRLLLKAPSGVRDPQRVFRLYFTRTFSWAGLVTQDGSSYPDFALLRDQADSFEHVAAFLTTPGTIGRGANAQRIRQTVATADFFPLLGITPALGRFFTREEDTPPSGARVVVLSHAFWRRRFGGDSTVLGRSIELGPHRYTVIGVAADRFSGVDLEPSDLWVPLSAEAASMVGETWYRTRNSTWIRILARLRPDVPVARANAETTVLFRRALAADAGAAAPDSTARATLGPMDYARGPVTYGATRSVRVATWLSCMALVVLLIACASVANLLTTHAARRRREIAVRIALGVGRGRLVRMLLTESLLLAICGALGGLCLAFWGGTVIRELLLPDVAWDGSPIDGRVLAVMFGTMLVTALVTGLAPALYAADPDVAGALKAGVREGMVKRSSIRGPLIVLQVAFSVVLLVGAGLFVRSLHNVVTMDMGYNPTAVLVAELDLRGSDLTGTQVREFYARARDRVARLPGVASAALATSIPFYSSTSITVRIPGRDSLPRSRDGGPYVIEVTPGYFETMALPIVAGRGFRQTDGAAGPRVAVVSEAFARTAWPGETALGKCLHLRADTVPCSEVVGIAKDAKRQSLETIPVIQFYLPLEQRQLRMSAPVLFVRASGAPDAVIPSVRAAMQQIIPNAPYVEVRPLGALIAPLMQPWRLGASMFALFGVLALVIASVGLHGVIGYEVAQRRHEFGVRLALGATPMAVLRLVLGRSVGLACIGVIGGAAVSVAGARFIAPLLFQTPAVDPAILAGVIVTLLIVAVGASVIPGRRASRVDPATALRTE